MTNYGWKCLLILFWIQLATVDVLTANNSDVSLVEIQTVHFR